MDGRGDEELWGANLIGGGGMEADAAADFRTGGFVLAAEDTVGASSLPCFRFTWARESRRGAGTESGVRGVNLSITLSLSTTRADARSPKEATFTSVADLLGAIIP